MDAWRTWAERGGIGERRPGLAVADRRKRWRGRSHRWFSIMEADSLYPLQGVLAGHPHTEWGRHHRDPRVPNHAWDGSLAASCSTIGVTGARPDGVAWF